MMFRLCERAASPRADPTTARRAERNNDREAGSATVFVIGFALVLLAMAGLVVDGGLALNARQKVADDVEQAARAGSLKINIPELRDKGVVAIDPGPATADAEAFLAQRGYGAAEVSVQADATQVTVTATIRQPTALLSLISIDSFTIHAAGQAKPTVGINAGVAP